VGRAVFKKGSTPRAVAMPSHSPHASHPSTFRAPGWGAPALPSSCRLRSVTLRRWAPFSHRSTSRIFIRQPGCIPSPMVTQDGDHHVEGGEKQAGLRPPPRPQLQGSSSSLLGRRARRAGACLRVGWRPASSSGIWGGNHPPALRRRRPPAMRGKANCCCLARVQHSVLYPGDCGQPHRRVSQHVVRREGGTCVLRWSRSRSCSEDGSEDLPVRFGAVGARWCDAGRQVAVVVGAEVVAAREGFSADEIVGATCGRTFGSLALAACPRPSCGDVGEGPPAATFALRPSLLLFSRPERRSLSLLLQWSAVSHPEFVDPQALRCGGCSYPREWNRSSICNGTLSAGGCSLWLSGPEHLGI
jgi:hypothetical protein